jgi:hypothetical protein
MSGPSPATTFGQALVAESTVALPPVLPVRGSDVTIEAEYRQYAQQCIESARAAESEAIRQTFLDIAKLWMMAAARIDSGAGISLASAQVDGHALPTDGMAPNESS